jgi:predicted phosphodiesterase
MRIHLLSDLHLELRAWEPSVRDADVTILAGDIHKGDRVMARARAHFSGPVLVVALPLETLRALVKGQA